MKSKPEVQLAEPGNRQGDTLKLMLVGRHRFLTLVAGAVAIFVLLFSGIAPAQDDSSENSPTQLRRFIDEQVGGIQKLKVPDNDHLPQARLPDGTLTDRKSTRLNSSHQIISYAVFCLKKKKN